MRRIICSLLILVVLALGFITQEDKNNRVTSVIDQITIQNEEEPDPDPGPLH